MANTQLKDTPFLDILPPPAPFDHNLLWWLGGITVVMLTFAALHLYWQRRPRQQALHRLNQLRRQLDADPLNHRHTLFELDRLLRRCLGRNRLDTWQTPHRAEWQAFYQRLQQQQYRASAPDQTQQLLEEAAHWLKGARR